MISADQTGDVESHKNNDKVIIKIMIMKTQKQRNLCKSN